MLRSVSLLIRMAVAVSLFLLGACSIATDSLQGWGRKESDNASAFLVTADGRDLVIIGERYHYVLSPADPGILAVIAHEKRALFSMVNSSVRLSRKGELSGFLVIGVNPGSLSTEEKTWLKATGYQGTDTQWQHLFTISGRAYRPNDKLQELPVPLSRSYLLWLSMEESRWQQAVKLPLTPVAFAADIGLNLAGAALLVPASLVLCTYHGVQGGDGGICGGSL